MIYNNNIKSNQITPEAMEGYLVVPQQPAPGFSNGYSHHHDICSASMGEDLEHISKHEFATRFFDQYCVDENGLASGKTIASFLKVTF